MKKSTIKLEAARLRFLSHAFVVVAVVVDRKRDSRRHSFMSFGENVVVAETSHQMIEVLSFCKRQRA